MPENGIAYYQNPFSTFTRAYQGEAFERIKTEYRQIRGSMHKLVFFAWTTNLENHS